MTTIDTHEFAGRPVNGDINHYGEEPVQQKPIGEFVAALDALLAFPEIEAVRWRQYTPYFNDGDPCVFEISGADAKFVGRDDGGDDEDGWHEVWLSYPDGYWGTHDHHGRNGKPKPDPKDQYWRLYGTDFQPSDAMSEAARVFEEEMRSGAHYVVLRKVFGDPAEVTATRDGFDVECYDHD